MLLDLTAALDRELGAGIATRGRQAAARLREVYRSGSAPSSLALADDESAAAYAAYRMPATYAAVRAALSAAARDLGPQPHHLDLGGGTGAAVWAVATLWPHARSTVLDASMPALALGQRIARHGPGAIPTTRWEAATFGRGTRLPTADLTTLSYLVGELDEAVADHLVDAAVAGSRAVLVIEPGTPRGFAAVRRARRRLVSAGWQLAAPCPHAGECPIVDPDWCHFAVRLPRSGAHRALKDAERGFEDEKFAYVLALAPASALASGSDAEPSLARILRHPAQRKGLVRLRTCESDGELHDRLVSKRQGTAYRQARDLAWGDAWSPPPLP